MTTAWTENRTLSRVLDHFHHDIDDPYLAAMAARCLLNTLETTVRWESDELPYVVTGDIPAMWLRDSSAQVEPYVRFVNDDAFLRGLVRGMILRQARYILEDPYANAFNRGPTGDHGFPADATEMGPWVYERKFEIDSLAHPIRLWWMYVEASGDTSVLNDLPVRAVERILQVLRDEMDHRRNSRYRFQRFNAPTSDTLVREGQGPEHRPTGMVWSGFRPSDDATVYPYLVPAEMFLAVCLDMVAGWGQAVWHDQGITERAEALKSEILEGILRYASTVEPLYGRIWAYEVDGLGHVLLMDDANIPSLLSLPFLGFCPTEHPVYQNTRRFVLSQDNPYYFQGNVLAGVGSPHTPASNAWPLAVIMEGLTDPSSHRGWGYVRRLAATDGGTGLMHESINVDRPEEFTRPWFAWANSMFAELVLRLLGYAPVARLPLVPVNWGFEDGEAPAHFSFK